MKIRLSLLREYLAEHGLSFLIENRIDDAREKYPDIEDDVWDSLVANQPAGSNNKYLQWSAKQVDDGTMSEEIVMAIRLFHDNVNRLKQKDINQYEDVDALNTAIDELHKNKSKSQEAKQAKADTQVIYNDDRWLVVRPFTTEASCKYGAGSKWCISATATRNYFNQYSVNNNKFYFVIDKSAQGNSANSKFAIAIVAMGLAAAGREIQVYDATDKLIPISVVANHVGDKWSEIWPKIQEHVQANSKTREVEEAEKATEEHVKTLLKGDKIGDAGLQKIAKDGKLTTPVIKALLKHYENYAGPTDYRDTRSPIISSLAARAADMPGDAAMLVMKWIGTTKPADGNYWSGSYHLDNMFRHANLSPENFKVLAVGASEHVLANIFSNPNSPEEVKSAIAGKVQEFREKDAKNKIIWELIKSGKITDDQFRLAVTPTTPGAYNYLISQVLQGPEEVKLTPDQIRMIPIKSVQEFQQLIKIRNVPPDFAAEKLGKLISGSNIKKSDLYELLRSTPLGVDQVEQLWADKPTTDVRTALLQNPGIGPGNASKFAKSKNSAYRFSVAHNPVTPPEDLDHLAGDESVSTRAAVGSNLNASAETLLKLAKDEAIQVRASVAGNTSAGRNVINALRKDSDSFVRKAAAKTFKNLGAAESMIRHLMGMGSLLVEELNDDDETPDIMNPSWRDISSTGYTPQEFICIYLLQNNGSATREELQEAYQDWHGHAGDDDMWKSPKHSSEIFRGSTSGGKGWYWAPPGINKGALFRLTPAGAGVAMKILNHQQLQGRTNVPSTVESANARPGKDYYTPQNGTAFDITGYESGTLTVEKVMTDYNGQPITSGGKYTRAPKHPSRRHRSRTTSAFKYTSPSGESKHILNFPSFNLPENTKVTFIKTMHGYAAEQRHQSDRNKAIVKHGERFLLIPFPLWVEPMGTTPVAREPNVAPPVRKSPPPAALTGRQAAANDPDSEPDSAPAPRGPKTTYKIYGKFKGHPVATRLKGKAYVGANDTQFAAGEQAIISPEDGKLRVKKADADHSQLWEPIDG